MSATITAHADEEARLLMVEITAAEQPEENTDEPNVRLALVLDRSGSMSGAKLDATRKATAKLIRSLKPEDRVAMVVYDNNVNVLTDLAAPNKQVANLVEEIFPGGNTNLYGGWVQGAELVGSKGNVVLLSDGLANMGMFVDAENLQSQAYYAHTKNGVTTSTIGVGEDYDEALMAGMAKGGGGNHYFAQDVDAIMEAFGQERFALGAIALEKVTLTWGKKQHDLRLLFGGEVKRLVLPLKTLNRKPPILAFTVRATGERVSLKLRLPTEFGHDDNVTLEHLLGQIADLQEGMAKLRDSHTAGKLLEQVMQALEQLQAHPLAKSEIAQAVIKQLRSTAQRLRQLQHRYDAGTASTSRKAGLQAAHSMRDPYKGFASTSSSDYVFMQAVAQHGTRSVLPNTWQVDVETLGLVPLERWLSWKAAPIECRFDYSRACIVMVNPRDAFLRDEITKALGKKLEVEPSPITLGIIKRLLKGERLGTP
jgi:Mg-chelatase subunit ChlD